MLPVMVSWWRTGSTVEQLPYIGKQPKARTMPTKPQSNDSCIRVTTDEPVSGTVKLDRLKARLFPPESEPIRVARALEAIQKAVRRSSLSSEALKEIAQHVDLEGF